MRFPENRGFSVISAIKVFPPDSISLTISAMTKRELSERMGDGRKSDSRQSLRDGIRGIDCGV